MAKQIYNNFIYGETDKYILGRTDLKAYLNSGSKIENFRLNYLGGLSKREGLSQIKELDKKTRIIEFVYSSDLAFLLLFSDKELRIVDTTTQEQIGEVIETQYKEEDLFDIQYAQNEESIYFVHIDYPIQVLDYVGNTFTFSTFVCSCDDEHKDILTTENNYPSVVAFCSSRLYFASSRNKPFTIWISNAYEPSRFWTYTLGTSTVTEQCSFDEYPAYFENWKNGNCKGASMTYAYWYNNELLGTSWWSARLQQEGSSITPSYNDLLQTDTQLFGEVMTVENTEEIKTYTDENAMILELASSKNDKITFINILHNIVVGTRSSEWILPYDLTPSNLKATKESSYGSSFIQSISMETELVFLQSSGCLRSMKYDYVNYNYPCEDRTIFNKEILQSGVVEMKAQTTPYARLFCILKDNTIAILTKNELEGAYGWTRYKSDDLEFQSIAVAEVEGVQQVFITCKDKNEEDKYYLAKLDETKISDLDKGYAIVSEYISNPIESTSLQSLDSLKYGWNITLRTYDSTKYCVGFSDCILQWSEGNKDIITIQVPTKWDNDLRLVIKSEKDRKLNISVMQINMGAS